MPTDDERPSTKPSPPSGGARPNQDLPSARPGRPARPGQDLPSPPRAQPRAGDRLPERPEEVPMKVVATLTVTGADEMTSAERSQVNSWLRAEGSKLLSSPLPDDYEGEYSAECEIPDTSAETEPAPPGPETPPSPGTPPRPTP